MTGVSPEIKALYTDYYGSEQGKAWRDTGAVDKADNIVNVWRETKSQPARPSIVEIGCGEGAVAAALAERGFFSDYLGFDLSTSGIAEAKARNVPGAVFKVSEGDDIAVPDRSADLAVLSHVVEHLEHPRVLLREAARIAPYVAVEVPLELTARAPKDYEVDALGHINKYNSTAIRHLVQSCGFEVLVAHTTSMSLATTQFFEKSFKRRMVWEIRTRGLQLVPPLAKQLFTYHEILLLKSPDRGTDGS